MAPVFKINDKVVRSPEFNGYELTPVVADEERNENGDLLLRAVTKKYKNTWPYGIIVGRELIEILGESWDKYVGNKTYKFKISVPNVNGGQLEYYAYFKAITFDLIIWDDDPNLRVYDNFTMTWIEY